MYGLIFLVKIKVKFVLKMTKTNVKKFISLSIIEKTGSNKKLFGFSPIECKVNKKLKLLKNFHKKYASFL